MRTVIGVDLDTTLNNLEKVWIERYNKDWGDNLTSADMISWDPTKYVKPECGKKIYNYFYEPGFFRNLGIKEHAKEVMEFLWNHFDVYIVSSAHPNVVADKWAWIQEHLPFIPYGHFIPLTKKDLLKMDYLIDDGPHNIESFSGTGILFDMPYNHYLMNRYYRVKNWREIYMYFKRLVENK